MRGLVLWVAAATAATILVASSPPAHTVETPPLLPAKGEVRGWGWVGMGGMWAQDPQIASPSATVPTLGGGSGVVALAAGSQHSLAVRVDGGVLAWGLGTSGQLGAGSDFFWANWPRSVIGLGPDSGVVGVAAGDDHSLAVKADGSVLAWGSDSYGQLGVGDVTISSGQWRQTTPVPVSGIGPGSGVRQVAASGIHSLALLIDGTVLAWGSNDRGGLGTGQANGTIRVPAPVTGLGPGSGVVAIAAGRSHNLALRADGTVLSWGSNSFSQLGHQDPPTSGISTVPQQVAGLGPGSGVVAIATGADHSLARLAHGSLLAWGDDRTGQLGDGESRVSQGAPVQVSGLGPGAGVVAMAAGYGRSLATLADGSVMSWGENGSFGALGDGGHADRGVPGPVTGLGPGSDVVAFATGRYHSVALADAPVGETYRPLSPARIWDTRVGPGPRGSIGSGGTRILTVTGSAGIPAAGVTAVVLNLTAGATASTYLTVWPTGQPMPLASNLNLPAGDVRSNLVTVRVGVRGQISLYNAAGSVDLVADVAGWYGLSGGQGFNEVSPVRLFDTRTVGNLALGHGDGRNITVTGKHGVPYGASAAVLNVTAVNPSAPTALTVWPMEEPQPDAVGLIAVPGDNRANQVVVKLSAEGRFTVANLAGMTHVVIDVAGYYARSGTSLSSLPPARSWDTRSGPGTVGPVTGGSTRTLQVAGATGVPGAGARTVVLNLTAVGPTAVAFVTVWPAGEPRPLASNLNVRPGDVRANHVTVKVGAGGKVNVFSSSGSVHLIADVAGWYGLT